MTSGRRLDWGLGPNASPVPDLAQEHRVVDRPKRSPVPSSRSAKDRIERPHCNTPVFVAKPDFATSSRVRAPPPFHGWDEDNREWCAASWSFQRRWARGVHRISPLGTSRFSPWSAAREPKAFHTSTALIASSDILEWDWLPCRKLLDDATLTLRKKPQGISSVNYRHSLF